MKNILDTEVEIARLHRELSDANRKVQHILKENAEFKASVTDELFKRANEIARLKIKAKEV